MIACHKLQHSPNVCQRDLEAVMTREAVGFHHIARTGGAALIRRMYDAGPKEPWNLAALDATASADKIKNDLAHLPSSSPILFHSHNAFGVHKIVDWNVRYFTILREPVAHTVSMFYWASGLELRALSNSEIVDRLTAFVHSFDHLNHQTYELAVCAQDRLDPNTFPSSSNLVGDGEALLRPALNNISNMFLFVGQTDRPSETHRFLEETFGFSDLEAAGNGFENQSLAPSRHGAARTGNLPEELLQLISSKTQVDQLLFRNSGFVKSPARSRPERIEMPPRQSATYRCKLDQPWTFFVEGLLGLGAKIGEMTVSEAGTLHTWALDFGLPLDDAASIDLVCSLTFTAVVSRGEVQPVIVTTQVGSAARQLGTLDSASLSRTLNCPALGSELVGGAIRINITASVRTDDRLQEGSEQNPIPYLLQSILVRRMAVYDHRSPFMFSLDNHGQTALVSGFAAPQSEGFSWSASKHAQIIVRVNEASRQELLCATLVNETPVVLLQFRVASLYVEGRHPGQTLVLTYKGYSDNMFIDGPSVKWVSFLFRHDLLEDDVVILDLEFPDAITLNEAIGHPDTINPHSVMFYELRFSPVGNLLSPSKRKELWADEALTAAGRVALSDLRTAAQPREPADPNAQSGPAAHPAS